MIKIIKTIQLNYKMIFKIFIKKIRAIAKNKKRGQNLSLKKKAQNL